MARRKTKHRVQFELPTRDLGNNDLRFEVHRGRERIGELLVSRGAIEWTGARMQHRRKLSWDQFSKVMQRAGTKRRKPGR